MNGNRQTYPMHFGAPPYVFKLANQRRRNMTPAENILWEMTRNHRLGGFKIRRMHPAGNFILDFYCASHRRAIFISQPGRSESLDSRLAAFLLTEDISYIMIASDLIINYPGLVRKRILRFLYSE